jgi:hypothetical protein
MLVAQTNWPTGSGSDNHLAIIDPHSICSGEIINCCGGVVNFGTRVYGANLQSF